jgi:hypothetical protein
MFVAVFGHPLRAGEVADVLRSQAVSLRCFIVVSEQGKEAVAAVANVRGSK